MASSPEAAPSRMYPPGSAIGTKYRVERLLGDGGMGVVVEARHVELGERVAIKLLRREAMESEASLARFRREGRAAAKIRSKHVARVFDVDALEDGTPYIVMELLEGHDLSVELERKGALNLEEALPLFLQACEAVAVAHAAGVVHRDLKPSNLFIAQSEGEPPIVKVLDFGISKVVEPSGADEEALHVTTAFETLGSPVYMSPEQMRSSRDVDLRTDIWSLGVILYKLLTGRVPFPGTTVTDVCARILVDSAPSLRQTHPDLPAAVDRAILRCLAKTPRDRFQTVGELAMALDSVVADSEVSIVERIVRVASAPLIVTGPEGVEEASQAVVGDARGVMRDAPTEVGSRGALSAAAREEVTITGHHPAPPVPPAVAGDVAETERPAPPAAPGGSRWPVAVAFAVAAIGLAYWRSSNSGSEAVSAATAAPPPARTALSSEPVPAAKPVPPAMRQSQTQRVEAGAPAATHADVPEAPASSTRIRMAPRPVARKVVEAPRKAQAPAPEPTPAPAPPPSPPTAGDDHPLHL